MDVYVEGQKITLSQSNFVAKGGEGSIFHKGNYAYKIYENLSQMIPLAKINELSQFNHPSIVAPKSIIKNNKKQIIGFTMDWIGENNIALAKMFTTRFQQINGINNDMIIQLIENIKKVTKIIHQNNFLIVDGNELNYLVKPDFITPYFIDVNSWQTPSFPATAIMPSIRDWMNNNFTVLTDWFSFAIISFQLFVGIHPFKGKHNKYRLNDFVNRIRDRVSVFNSEVSLPPSVRSFDLIPSSYKDWYYKLFERGDRTEPPQLPGQAEIIQVEIKVIQSTNTFEINLIKEYNNQILYHNPINNITRTKTSLYLSKTDYNVSNGVEVIITPLFQIPILIKIDKDMVEFKPLKPSYTIKGSSIACSDMMIINNTLYLKNKEKLIEVTFKELSQNIIPVVKTVWNIEPLSSKIFTNVIYQSVLGKAHFCIPIPNESGKSSFNIIPIPELNDYRILEAKYDNHILNVIAHYQNEYHRFTFIISQDFQTYVHRLVSGIDYNSLNFITLDNGVCIMIPEDNVVEMFLNRIDKPDVKRIIDPDITSDMRLVKDGTVVKFFKDKTLYSLKMKK